MPGTETQQRIPSLNRLVTRHTTLEGYTRLQSYSVITPIPADTLSGSVLRGTSRTTSFEPEHTLTALRTGPEMIFQSPEQCDSTKHADSSPANNSTPPEVKIEDVLGPHTQRTADVKEASGSYTTPDESSQSKGRRTALGRLRHILTWAPKNCRYDPNEPPQFSLSLNLLFALVRFRLGTPTPHV